MTNPPYSLGDALSSIRRLLWLMNYNIFAIMILYAYLVFCYNLDFLKNTKPNLYKAFYKFYYTWMT